MRLITFVLINLFCHILFAQDQETVHISGTIVNSEDLTPVPFVHIINITKRTGLTSDQSGRFSFEVPKSDTLYFSSVGFKITRITFKDSTDRRYERFNVLLYPETITLNPVEIRAYNLEEILNKAKEKELSMQRDQPQRIFEPAEKVEKPTMGLAVSPSGGVALEGAITAFANLFNKEFKQRKKLKEILEKEAQENEFLEIEFQLQTNYLDIARKITGLNEEEFGVFANLYMPDFDFLWHAGDFDLALRVYEDFRDFRYKYKLEEVSLDELMENAKFRK